LKKGKENTIYENDLPCPTTAFRRGFTKRCPQNFSCRRRAEWKGHGRLKNELRFIKTIYEIFQIKKTPYF